MPERYQLKPDDIAQIKRLIGTVNALLDRYSRLAEEYDSNRLALEELREILSDHFEENARWSDDISRRMDRLEQYVILARMGEKNKAGAITQKVTGEHLERGLREELSNQQEQLLQYQRNIAKVKIRIAKFGENTQTVNELEEYEAKAERIAEAIERIRETLNRKP